MPNDMAPVRRAVRVWLAEQDKTQTWLAKKVRIDHSTLSKILTGVLPPSQKLARRLTRVTGIDFTSFDRAA